MNRINRTLGAVLLTLSISSLAFASDDREEGGDRRGHEPPRVALEACSETEETEACSFEGRRGEELTGTCETIQGQLACVPEGRRRDHRGRGRR